MNPSIIVIVILAILAIFAISIYNNLVRKNEMIEKLKAINFLILSYKSTKRLVNVIK